MSTLEKVRKEIVDLHDFFVKWFNGTADRDQLEPQFLSQLHENVMFIPPEGHAISGKMLKEAFDRGYGSNTDFKIQIRDVAIQHEINNIVLATYTEWQIGATQSAQANNARITSVLMEMGTPVTWLHIQETWLPEAIRSAGSFDF